jgi:hypothetical protein
MGSLEQRANLGLQTTTPTALMCLLTVPTLKLERSKMRKNPQGRQADLRPEACSP